MKSVFVPVGECVHYDSLYTEHLVVKGYLEVDGALRAKSISGDGVICAGSVTADMISMGDMETSILNCQRLLAKRVIASNVVVSESAAVSCYLSAAFVKAGRLVVSASEISEVEADEVINLPTAKRSLFGTLLLASLHTIWTAITAKLSKYQPLDADYEPISHDEDEANADSTQKTQTAPPRNEAAPVDEELNRVVNMYHLCKQNGYTLRVVPGTPEANAPVFDFEHERIVRPAA